VVSSHPLSSVPPMPLPTVQDVSVYSVWCLPCALSFVPLVWVTIGANLVILLVCTIMSVAFTIRNKQARSGKGGPIEGREGFFYTI